MNTAQLAAAGANPGQQAQGGTIFHNRFKTGLWTQRNPFRDPSSTSGERYYGGGTDALLDGLNVEITNRLTLARAAGTSAWSSAVLSGAPAFFYSFKTFTTNNESIDLIVDTPAAVLAVNATAASTVLTKTPGAGAATFVGINGVLYFGDGIDNRKWISLGTAQHWGTSGATSSVSSGFGAAANAGGTGTAWTNPANVIQPFPSVNYATVALNPGDSSQQLQVTVPSIPYSITAFLCAIIMQLRCFLSGAGTVRVTLQLLFRQGLTGAIFVVGQPRTRNITVTSSTQFTWGDALADDLWGGPWSYNQATALDTYIGVQIQVTNIGSGAVTFSANDAFFQVMVTGPNTVTATVGSLSPATGYRYVQAFGNSKTGLVSVANPASALIHPIAQGVQVLLLSSAVPDPQIDQVWVFRTADGGSTYYNIPNSPFQYGTATIVDDAPDTQLNKLQLPDLGPWDGGQALNKPPAYGVGAPEMHLGRMWGAVGNTVYYSAGSDLGLIVGNGNESFPAANFFTFPSQVTRLLSVSTVDSAFLLVFTISDVYAIFGNASAIGVSTGVSGLTQFYAVPFLRRTGLLNYGALDIRGTQIYMFTADKRLITFNPSSQVVFLDPEKSIEEIGFPIGAAPPGVTLSGGTLDSFNPSTAFVSWHGAGSGDQALYVADGSTGWFRCNVNQLPDGGICWSPKRNITGGCGPVQSIETSPGVFQLLIGTSNSVSYRNTSAYSDSGTPYSAFGRFGGYVLAMPGEVGAVPFVTADYVKTGSDPTIGVLLDEIEGSFTTLTKTDNDPPHLAAPASINAYRYAARQASSGTQAPNVGRYLQLKVDFGSSDTVQNELLGLAIYGELNPQI